MELEPCKHGEQSAVRAAGAERRRPREQPCHRFFYRERAAGDLLEHQPLAEFAAGRKYVLAEMDCNAHGLDLFFDERIELFYHSELLYGCSKPLDELFRQRES